MGYWTGTVQSTQISWAVDLVFCPDKNSGQGQLGKCKQATPHAKVTVSYPFENVWEMFTGGFLEDAQECTIKWRSPVMRDSADKAFDTIKILVGESVGDHKEIRKLKGFSRF